MSIPPIRASDAEREDTVVVLQRALGEGRLDVDETDTRITAAYAARHRHELAALVADLPAAAPPDAVAPRTGRRRWAGRPASLVAAVALGAGLVAGAVVGGIHGVSFAGPHAYLHRDHVLPGGSWSRPTDGGTAPAQPSFWLPPRGV